MSAERCTFAPVHWRSLKRQNTHVLGIGSSRRRTRRRVSAGCTCAIISLRLFMTASLSATLNAGYTERESNIGRVLCHREQKGSPPGQCLQRLRSRGRRRATIEHRRPPQEHHLRPSPGCIRSLVHLFRVLRIWVHFIVVRGICHLS